MLLKNRILQCYNRDMDVYIEYVIIDNFVITFMIAALTYKLMLKHVAKLRSAIAAVVGTAIAIAYPFVYNDVLVIVIKLGLWVALSFCLQANRGFCCVRSRFWQLRFCSAARCSGLTILRAATRIRQCE